MLTEEEKEQALERAGYCGWKYDTVVNRDKSVSYCYKAKGGTILAYIDGCRASVYDDRIGHDLFSEMFPENKLFQALTKFGRAADEIAGTFRDVENIISGL